MKLIYIIFLFCFIGFCACRNNSITPSLLNTSNLSGSFVIIDADSAYSLKTGKGAIIKIAANTFKVEKGQKINIEIKEAYTMQDILLAGLSTQSNGRALRSGGMIYFNATSQNKPLDINIPVDISIPSEMYDPSMQLFKGEIKDDNSINWVAPQALDTTGNANMILNGEALFKASCASCHKIFKDFTAPPLAGSGKRAPNKQWVYDFINNPAKMIGAKEPYAYASFLKWKPLVMTSFPQLTKTDIDAIMAYVENESKLNPESYVEYNLPADSTNRNCGYDTIINELPIPQEGIEIMENDADGVNKEQNDTVDSIGLLSDTKDFAIHSGIYNFKIEENGWFNVDVFVNENFISINATVNLHTEADMKAYLFFPEKKSLLYGALSNSNSILFYDGDKNNQVRAPIGAEAILLVFGSDNTDMYYAVERFKIKDKQDIILQPKKTTEAGLLSLIKQNNIDGFKIDVYKNDWEVIEKPCDSLLPEKSTTAPMPDAVIRK